MNHNTSKFSIITGVLSLFFLVQGTNVFSQDSNPRLVQAGKNGKAPSDAIVLFDKGSLNSFESVVDQGPVKWNVSGKKFTVVPGAKDIQTKERFGDCQLHIEWRSPIKDVRQGKTGRGCGNSGIYLMGKYEVQVINSYNNDTGIKYQAGSVYDQTPPLVNAAFKPGKWQTYDIIFTAPRYNKDGLLETPPYVTVFHNGVLVQNHTEILGPTTSHNKTLPITDSELPLMLQEHSNEVSYRNIWIRKI